MRGIIQRLRECADALEDALNEENLYHRMKGLGTAVRALSLLAGDARTELVKLTAQTSAQLVRTAKPPPAFYAVQPDPEARKYWGQFKDLSPHTARLLAKFQVEDLDALCKYAMRAVRRTPYIGMRAFYEINLMLHSEGRCYEHMRDDPLKLRDPALETEKAAIAR